MKKTVLGIFILVFALQFLAITSAEICKLEPSLINQDPYPVMPGEVVKVVFQIKGVSNPECGKITTRFIEKFPFTLDKGYDPEISIQGGAFVKDFKSYLLAPYKVKVDEDALEGEEPLSIEVSSSTSKATYDFNIEIDDVRTDFELSVKEYDSSTKTLTFQILNIGENDVEALTVDIPNQENIEVKGSSRNIVGSLDSNDDTTFSFEASPNDGEMNLVITYTDTINERRTLEKTVMFDSNLFNGRNVEKEGRSIWFYIVVLIVLVYAYRWYAERKRKKHHH